MRWLICGLVCLLSIELSDGATLAGKPVQGGGMVEIRFAVANGTRTWPRKVVTHEWRQVARF